MSILGRLLCLRSRIFVLGESGGGRGFVGLVYGSGGVVGDGGGWSVFGVAVELGVVWGMFFGLFFLCFWSLLGRVVVKGLKRPLRT